MRHYGNDNITLQCYVRENENALMSSAKGYEQTNGNSLSNEDRRGEPRKVNVFNEGDTLMHDMVGPSLGASA